MPIPPLDALIADESAPLGAIAALLDGMLPGPRWSALRNLTRAQMRELYRRAEEGPPVTTEDFVPVGVPPRTQVIHRGRNTLPLPGALRFFEKRFCRPDAPGDTRLFGFNEGPTRKLIGPGYFVLRPTRVQGHWVPRGAMVVDYYQVPDAPVVPTWPRVVPNTHGIQVLVFHKTRDFMRRVSSHVTIGAAFKGEWELDHYFVLCREV